MTFLTTALLASILSCSDIVHTHLHNVRITRTNANIILSSII